MTDISRLKRGDKITMSTVAEPHTVIEATFVSGASAAQFFNARIPGVDSTNTFNRREWTIHRETPEEPMGYGVVIRFKGSYPFFRSGNRGAPWRCVNGSSSDWTWARLIDQQGAEFEVLHK